MSNKGDANGQPVCPVDHSTREAWLKHSAKPGTEFHDAKIEKPSFVPPTNDAAAEKCPVDHSSRKVWLSQAKSQPQSITSNGGESFESSANGVEECSSDRLDSLARVPGISQVAASTGLSTDREISTIPRASPDGGNWVYPSQAQFYNAMKRKNWDPKARDMESVVPIHNAVNERAWVEILKWEEPAAGGKEALAKCGGPQLVRFSGDAKKISPKARINMTFFGFQKPFDRHDWLVDRCGKQQVEYVIDFYTGKPNPLMPDMPSFYLDVRPKLNSFEGCRMRFMKWIGMI